MSLVSLAAARRKAARSLPAWALAGAALVVAVLFMRSFPADLPGPSVGSPELHAGEDLIHGVRSGVNVSYAMPLQSVLSALVSHLPAGRLLAAALVVWTATMVLAFTLGCLLHSPLAGGLSALAASRLLVPGLDYPAVYPVCVLLAANVLAWAGRSPGLWGGLALGAALGLSLLERSPLFLFPLVAAVYALRTRQSAPRQRWSYAAALVLTPLVLLIPWMRMNHALHGRLVVFEAGRADANIVSGSLGAVSTLEGDHFRLVGVPEDLSPLAWAAGQVLGDPLRYLAACARRAGLVLSMHPALFLLAAVGLTLFRSRHGFRLCGLLAAYYFAVHCAMPVQPRYFTPLWPILAGLAASLAAEAALPAAEPSGRQPCAGPVAAVYALCLGMGLFALHRVALFPAAGADTGLEAGLRRQPMPACLWSMRGKANLGRRDVQTALPDLRRAALLGPRIDRLLDYAWALILADSPGQDLIHRLNLPAAGGDDLMRWRLIRAVAYLRKGKSKEALAAIAEAAKLWDSMWGAVRSAALASNPLDRELQARLDLASALTPERELAALFKALPVAEQTALADRLTRLRGQAADQALPRLRRRFRGADWWFALAEQAADSGDRKGFILAAQRALEADASVSADARLASLCLRTPDPRWCLPVLRRRADGRRPDVLLALARLAAREGSRAEARLDPNTPDPWLESADLAAREGRSQEALALLMKARALPMKKDHMLMAARLYRNMGDSGQALEMSKDFFGRTSGDAAGWLVMAELAVDAGVRPAALSYLERAGFSRPSPDELGKAAVLFQRLGEHRRSLAILNGLLSRDPDHAAYLGDRGVAHALLGNQAEAMADLRHAIAADPGLLSSYLSLGSLLTSCGRRSEALRVYDDALRQPGPDRQSLRKAVHEARAALLENRIR
ncbi:MAG: tetratricopeptide repeat protein [Elusimicrobia bacterium]|nr:tetratricopeptide repeat protein [Elusimicrobiota bacterium]